MDQLMCFYLWHLELWMIFFFFIVFVYIFQMFFAVSLYFSHQKSCSNVMLLPK